MSKNIRVKENENKDLISVIVPIYKVEKYLSRCVDSIINQIYKNLEIILVDDGSPDNCGMICDEYAKKDNRIKVFHTKNEGVSSARNLGIKNSTGYWICFVDSDDWIERDFCLKLINSIQENCADIVLCGYNRVTGKNKEKINSNGKSQIINGREYLIKCLNPQTNYGFCHMKLIKKKAIDEIRFNKKLKVGEDALFNIEISSNVNTAIFIKENLYNYRINIYSTVRKFDIQYVDKYLNAIKITSSYLKRNYELDKEILQNFYNFVAFHVMLIAVNYCYNPENKLRKKISEFSKICDIPEFKEGITKSNYNNLSITRKVTLFTIKHKLYFITQIICKIRQIQNRKK